MRPGRFLHTLLPAVFDIRKRPRINPDGASVKEIIETVEKHPSGALNYTLGRRRYQDVALSNPASPSLKTVRCI